MKQNAILLTWIQGCTQILDDWGGYTFIWHRGDGTIFHKELRDHQVTNRVYDAEGKIKPQQNLQGEWVDELTVPIDIGKMDIIRASVEIKKSGKLAKR
jgi:hypothetical protein